MLLYKLTQRPYDETLLGFLFIDEHLVDIGDDLVDYEVQHSNSILLNAANNSINGNPQNVQDDVIANSFNIYRGDKQQLSASL